MKHSGVIQGTYMEHAWSYISEGRPIQGTFREHSGIIQGTFRDHSGNIQGTYMELHIGLTMPI
jgi:hypothetical protein